MRYNILVLSRGSIDPLILGLAWVPAELKDLLQELGYKVVFAAFTSAGLTDAFGW